MVLHVQNHNILTTCQKKVISIDMSVIQLSYSHIKQLLNNLVLPVLQGHELQDL